MKMTLMQAVEHLELSQERTKPPKGYPKDKRLYAVEDEFLFPLDDEKHVRSAIKLFGHHKFKSEEQKRQAAKKILRYAKKYDIEVSEKTEVWKAAHSE